MKDRLITALGALLACVFVYGLFFGTNRDVPVTRPVSTEPGRNGYVALADWLRESGIAVVSWQRRFDDLLDDGNGLAESGNVMLTTMPHLFEVRLGEQQTLNGWIRRGNTLLVLAAIDDTPEWSAAASGSFFDDLTAITGLVFTPGYIDDDTSEEAVPAPDVEPGEAVVLDALPHPLMAGVATLEGLSDEASAIWYAYDPYEPGERPPIALANERRSRMGALYQLPVDEGQILLSLSASLLANHQIDEADNGRLVANLVAHHLGPGGAFVFDDMHQGLSALYNPAAFYSDPRLYATIAFLVAAWFVWLVGASNRIAPVHATETGPHQSDLLGAVGGFMARRLDRRDAGTLLFDDWFREVRQRRGLVDDEAPPWEALAATPTLSAALLARLRQRHEEIVDGYPVDLVGLHNLIRQARKAIG